MYHFDDIDDDDDDDDDDDADDDGHHHKNDHDHDTGEIESMYYCADFASDDDGGEGEDKHVVRTIVVDSVDGCCRGGCSCKWWR